MKRDHDAQAAASTSSERPPAAPTWSGLVLDRLAAVASEHSDKIAVRCGEASLSYAQLSDRADGLARQLAASGIVAGDLVGIGMDRSIDMVAAVLGVWKAGAAFVPLDPDHPAVRLAQVVEDAAPRALITNRCDWARTICPNTELIVFDNGTALEAAPNEPVQVVASDIAYVIFTSGSTGRPKGVEVSHGAVANFMAGMHQCLQMEPSDTLLAITTLSFDISILEITLPLMHGATVVVLDSNVSRHSGQLARALDHYRATYLQATPSTLGLLVGHGWNGKDDLTIVCGGENLLRPLAEALLQRSRRVFNVYGPTEATIWSTFELVHSGDGPVPIGRALLNYQTLVLDDDLRVVPRGERGQLYLGGSSLATGYLNRPQETEQRFISHPDEGRLYATGDLVRETEDGKLVFLGRLDDQVKIRGFRVELGDIEAALRRLPGVKDSLVLLREDTPDDAKLVAYVIPKEATDFEAGFLRDALSTRLPSYMIPHHYVLLAEFPTTSNNKVDRKQLPAPAVSHCTTSAAVLDPLEAYLHSVWINVLGTQVIDRDDNFFHLGGDSLRAARITNRVERWLGEVVWPMALFDAPTVGQFASYLRRNYPVAVATKTRDCERVVSSTTDRTVDDKLVAEFNSLIRPIAPMPSPAIKNPPAIFVLCPPRSGSTLLRVMLAGHPLLFAPPELELLTFNTMRERAEVFSGRERYRLEGTIRAVMEINRCDVDEARNVLAGYEQSRTTIPEFYGIMQQWLKGRRLVDKTPSNTLDLDALRLIEDYFDEPIYIHLTRHPLAMVRSFLEARLDAVFFRRTPHSFSPRELAELVWLTSHRKTLTALASVPAARQFTLAFEALVHAPKESIQRLCDFLNIELHPNMLEPWKNKDKKMADGLHPESKMMGDPKFHRYDRIDPVVADHWIDEMQGVALGTPTRAMARELGYPDAVQGNEREEFVV